MVRAECASKVERQILIGRIADDSNRDGRDAAHPGFADHSKTLHVGGVSVTAKQLFLLSPQDHSIDGLKRIDDRRPATGCQRYQSIVKHKHQKAAYCGLHFIDSDAYPPEYREKLYMGNIHGGCINAEVLQRDGATYFAKSRPDFLTANDKDWLLRRTAEQTLFRGHG